MKRINFILLASLCLAGMASCSKEAEVTETLDTPEIGPKEVVLKFTGQRPELSDATRTAWNGNTIVWSEGDKVRVAYTLDGNWMGAAEPTVNNSAKFYQSGEVAIDDSDPSVGTFSVPVASNSFIDPATTGKYVFYSLYPGGAVGSTINNVEALKVTVPSSQTPGKTTFEGSSDILVGKTAELSIDGIPTDPIGITWTRLVAHADLTFSNIAFVGEETIQSITLTTNEEAKLTGEISVNLPGGTASEGSSNELIVIGTNLVPSSNSVEAWVSVLPVTFTSLDVEIQTDKAKYAKSISGFSKTFKQNARNRLTINMSGADRTADETPWVKTYLPDVKDGDVFVIVGTNADGDYALSNDKGTSAAPTATAVTITNKTLTNPAATLQWTMEKSGDNYIFHPVDDDTKWLYCTDSNNGVRVGANTNSTFSLSEEGYLKHVGTSRYIGIYNSADWRCYTSIKGTSNIANQTFAFYVKNGAGSKDIPSITFSNPTDAVGVGKTVTNTVTTVPEGLSVTYSSSDTEVATVDASTGTVTGISDGTATITASFAGNDSYQAATAEYTITVTTPTTIAQVISGGVGSYEVPDVLVYAVKGSGLILGDESAKIYAHKSDHGLSVGDVRNVVGATQLYSSSVYQFNDPTFSGSETATVNHGEAVEFDEQANTLMESFPYYSAIYIHAKGTQSGRNITTTAGNVLYLSANEEATDGKGVEVYGYVYAYSSNFSNFNFMVTSIEVDQDIPALDVTPTSLNWAADETVSKTISVEINESGTYSVSPESDDNWNISDDGSGTITVSPKEANISTVNAKSLTLTITHDDDDSLVEEVVCTQAKVSSGEPTAVTDILNQTLTGITGTNYTAWNGKTSKSNAVYAGQSAGGNSSIQLRSSNSNSGVITTASGGKVTKIVVTWNSETSNGRTLNIYGKNSAYSAATDLYDSAKQGTLLGTIVKGTSTELTITGDYSYIGFRSNSGAMYLSEVQITWTTE
ncbi:MAG: Ig-like domain-containing protein [Bacteroidales bacterium]|nr:Ig-like domain-containing protein [Bacteroidales bacterium]